VPSSKSDSGRPLETDHARRTPTRTLSYHEDALAFLEGTTAPKKVRRQIKGRIDLLADDPKPIGHKKLDGVTDDDGGEVFRIRSGDYRIIYGLKADHTIVILDIGDRRDIYRKWKAD